MSGGFGVRGCRLVDVDRELKDVEGVDLEGILHRRQEPLLQAGLVELCHDAVQVTPVLIARGSGSGLGFGARSGFGSWRPRSSRSN